MTVRIGEDFLYIFLSESQVHPQTRPSATPVITSNFCLSVHQGFQIHLVITSALTIHLTSWTDFTILVVAQYLILSALSDGLKRSARR
jgi:hypothetical protein